MKRLIREGQHETVSASLSKQLVAVWQTSSVEGLRLWWVTIANVNAAVMF